MAGSKKGGEQAIGDGTVKAKTGKGWAEWFRVLDRWGAASRSHKEIAAYLHRERGASAWWSQSITVRYEQDRGLRDVGQTVTGWQTQVQKTLSADPETAWNALTRPASRKKWLDPEVRMRLQEGARYTLGDGTCGQVRAVRPGRMLRLGWESPTGCKSTLEVSLSPSRDGARTAMRFRHHGIATKAEQAALQKRWKAALGRISEILG